MKIEIKQRCNNSVLFSHECEGNTIKITMEAAVSAKTYLRNADLSGADLRNTDLSGADLSGAYLRGADLSGADLSGADLSGADLSGADLSGADLSGADLSGADLRGAKNIRDSHEVLAEIAFRFDVSLTPVAAMIRGRLVGCWKQYTEAIRSIFGEETIRRLAEAWTQDEEWGVRERLCEYGWIEE